MKTDCSAPKSLWTFFASCFTLSAFTFGGGYVIVPLQKRRFCDELGWIEEEEILNLLAIAQSSPGPIAINASILLGRSLFGLKGAILAVLATVLPPLLILSLLSYFYQSFSSSRLVRSLLKATQASVAALILHTILKMASDILRKKQTLQILLLVVCMTLALFTEWNVVYILLLAGLSAYLWGLRKQKRTLPQEEAKP